MGLRRERGGCSVKSPQTFRIGGPGIGEELAGVVFTPANPCGAVVSPGFVQTPLEIIGGWDGCLGDPCGPDDQRIMIEASMLAIDSDRGPGQITFPSMGVCDPNMFSTLSRIKLRVQACGMPEPVFIDSDSRLIVLPGNASIDVLAPPGWQQMGRVLLEAQTPRTDAVLRIVGCPLGGYSPRGILSEWLQNVTDATAAADRTLIRPRRARRLSVAGVTTVGSATANVTVQFVGDGGTIIGFQTFQAGFPIDVDQFGSAREIIVGAPSGTINIYVRWEIE